MPTAIDIAQSYWTQAISQPVGLGLIVSDPGRAKTQLYAARKALLARGMPLSNWTIRTSPTAPSHEIWLLRTSSPDPTPEAA